MKVAFLSVFAFDANISLINALKDQCDVYFFTEALHQIYNYIDKDQLQKRITEGNHVEQIQRFGDLIDLSKTFVIKGTKNSDLFRKIYNSYKIDAELKRIKPDVIVIDNITLTYVWSAIRLRKKALLIVHDPFQHSGEEFIIEKYLRKLFFRLISHKILLNNSQKDRFIKECGQNERYIHSSFLSIYTYLTYYHKDRHSETSSEEFNILFFGRISPYKGIRFLLETFISMLSAENIQNMTLTIAGSGDFDFDVSEYKSHPNIKIINTFVSPEDLSRLIAQSSVVVCPYTDATQSGVVMSAFAFKKPVIATNVGGLPEMVEHGKTGIIIEKNNKKDLRDAILSLYTHPEKLDLMRANIEQEYFFGNKSWKHSAELFLEAIQSIHQEN
ncbi:glycosyltransferase family 4 protein [uncultured Chryseobacterium sp.]|uniref:glycosyltransferase family 4 protein n=1 Tax=uncultured Chryseobacterium sp. TaxID=259322 RepID=UPI0025E8F33A|nr:glycosyltransferase family 4 protein [uncultured Chryseobacterium sp.]